jgi:hypothetical protein
MRGLDYMKNAFYHRAIIVITSLFFAFSADADDQVIAKFEDYLVIVHGDEIGSVTRLVRVEASGKQHLLSTDSDNGIISTKIESLLPQKEAWALIRQIAESDIKYAGGAKKYQETVDKYTKQYGKDFYNYLTPIDIEAYRANGVIIPYTPK